MFENLERANVSLTMLSANNATTGTILLTSLV